VIPGLIRRFHEAKAANTSEVVIWGTGNQRREFLFVDDMAAASVFIMQLDKATYISQTEPMQSHFNVGFGSDVTIKELALAVASATGYKGNIRFDSAKPDGVPRKWMDSSRLTKLGYKAKVNLTDGLHAAYSDFLENV
jgi:GDP-L-fucose synthase